MSFLGYSLFYVLVLTTSSPSKALITDSKLCPKLPKSFLGRNQTCDINVDVWRLEPLAHIPGGGHSINSFHNPYGPDQSCSFFQFFCRDDLPGAFGDMYMVPKMSLSMVCGGTLFIKVEQTWQVHIDHNPLRSECNVVEKWTNVELFVYEQNQYIFLYSCKPHTKDLNTEHGAWILVNINSTVERKQEVLNLGLEMFDQIPGLKRDWWIYPEKIVECWKNVNCSYFADCVPENEIINDNVTVEMSAIDLRYFSIIPIVLFIVVIATVIFVNCQKQLNRSRVIPYSN